MPPANACRRQQQDSPIQKGSYSQRNSMDGARPKKGWMAGRKLFFTRTSLRSYSHEGRDQAGTHFVFQRQVGGQMAVWKRSLASPRLHSAVGSSPNYDASTGCSASLCTPLHCTAWSVQAAVQAARPAPCGPRNDPQVVPGRPHCKSYKGLSSFHLFSAPDSPGW